MYNFSLLSVSVDGETCTRATEPQQLLKFNDNVDRVKQKQQVWLTDLPHQW